jgi:phosphoribosyl 1,2-cyclic phosphodiesterase
VDLADGSGVHAVFDCGTGIIKLGKSLLGGPCGKGQGEVHIFLSHTHWDHIQGFPFFIPGFIPGNRIFFWGRSSVDKPLFDLLNAQMKAEYSPIFHLQNMGSSIEVGDFGTKDVHFGEFTMQTKLLPHKGAASVGYRVSDDHSVVAFLGDAHYANGVPSDITDFVKGADVLIHDVGDDGEVDASHVAIELARAAAVKHLILTHYPPWMSDDDVAQAEELARRGAGSDFVVSTAYEGLTVTL